MIYKLLVGIHTSVNFCGKNGPKHVHVMLSEQGHIFLPLESILGIHLIE